MGNVLAFCETTGDSLRSSALSCLTLARTAAAAHGGEVIALLIGKGVGEAAENAAAYAAKVIVIDDAALEHFLAETYGPIVARVAGEQKASVVTATATAIGKDFMPRVAALLGAGMASDVASMEGKNVFTRAIMAGNAFSKVEVGSEVVCVTARQSNFDAATPLETSGSVEKAEAGQVDALGAEFVKLEGGKGSDRPDLNDAEIVVSGGRGMGNGENFEILAKLADVLGAAMGASRAATDAGYVPADWQVGQTGKIVAPNLYIAVAISGAIQHLAGMKNAKTIVAINKDPEAPIFQIADYGLVANWEAAVPELVEAIKELRATQS